MGGRSGRFISFAAPQGDYNDYYRAGNVLEAMSVTIVCVQAVFGYLYGSGILTQDQVWGSYRHKSNSRTSVRTMCT